MTEQRSIVDLIRQRRTHKRFNGDAVSREQLQELVDLLCWAPNHRMTQPWRAYVLDQAAIQDLGQWIKAEREGLLQFSAKPEKDRAKIDKLMDHYLSNLGALIQVTQVISDDPNQNLEDYAAVCAGAQNMLLGAEAMGLAHFWSTSALMANPLLLQHLAIDPQRERLVASLWLGGRCTDPIAPPRQTSYTTWIGSPSP